MSMKKTKMKREKKYLVGGGAAPRVWLHFKNQASVLSRPCTSTPVGLAGLPGAAQSQSSAQT